MFYVILLWVLEPWKIIASFGCVWLRGGNPVEEDDGLKFLWVTSLEILEIYGRKSSIVKFVDVSRKDPFWLVVWGKYSVYTHDVLCWEAQT